MATERMTVKQEHRRLFPWIEELAEFKRQNALEEALLPYRSPKIGANLSVERAHEVGRGFLEANRELTQAQKRREGFREFLLALRARFGLDRIEVEDAVVAISDQTTFDIDPADVQAALTEIQWKLVSEERTVRVLDLTALLRHANAGTVPRDIVATLLRASCKLNVELGKPKPARTRGTRPKPPPAP